MKRPFTYWRDFVDGGLRTGLRCADPHLRRTLIRSRNNATRSTQCREIPDRARRAGESGLIQQVAQIGMLIAAMARNVVRPKNIFRLPVSRRHLVATAGTVCSAGSGHLPAGADVGASCRCVHFLESQEGIALVGNRGKSARSVEDAA